MRTQVGIVGAGPAGLMLALLLRRAGIDSIVLESRSRHYIEHRIRAGLLEQWVADLLVALGMGERMRREGMFHDGIYLNFEGGLHHLDFRQLIGKGVTIYGQQEVVKDLIAGLLAEGVQILFETDDLSIHDFEHGAPQIHFRQDGETRVLDCDFIGGCDGFHGICRPSFPAGLLQTFERDYPFGWLCILSESAPPEDELIYTYHDRGFALFTMRSPTLARLYLQCAPDEDIANWPDARIWEELHIRLGGVRELAEGRMLQKGITPMRSFVAEPMRHGRLFLAGDAAHIVPPTGAKGLNLAVADVTLLATALTRRYADGDESLLDAYSETALRRVWRAEHFSYTMTTLLHRDPHQDEFGYRLQLSHLRYVAISPAASASLAENYVGLPLSS
jgi:p-hydroxybenzoate 3-monooxygenase